MSRHHQAHAASVSNIIRDIETLSPFDIETVYGITISDDGSVYDPTYGHHFDSVGAWADFCVEQDEIEYGEDIKHQYDYDD